MLVFAKITLPIARPLRRQKTPPSPIGPLPITPPGVNPRRVTKLVAWFRPSGIPGADGEEITTWRDDGPFRFVPTTSGSPGNRLVVKTNAINGYPAVRDPGAAGLIISSGFNLSNQDSWSVFAVAQLGNSGVDEFCCFQGDGINTGVRLGWEAGSPATFHITLPNVGDFSSNESVTRPTWHYVLAISDHGVQSLYVDGIAYTGFGTHLMSAGGNAFQLGQGSASAGRGMGGGMLADIAFYDKAVGLTGRSKLFRYARRVYGL